MATYVNKLGSAKRAQVGARIKIAVTQSGISLKELAERTQTSTAMIYQYVRGNVGVPPETLKRIAVVTETPLSFFDPDVDWQAPSASEGTTQEAKATPQVKATSSDPAPKSTVPDVTSDRIRLEFRQLNALFNAYDFPKRDRVASLSTLNQMLALARTVGNGHQQAWVLGQIGRNALDSDQLDEAKRYFAESLELYISEGLDEGAGHITLDLHYVHRRQGQLELAQRQLESLMQSPYLSIRWRALVELGNLRFQQHDFEQAISFYIKAAHLENQFDDEEERQHFRMSLMGSLADVLRATGHYEAALGLLVSPLEMSARERKPGQFLEALLEIAQCYHSMGKLSEAKQRLEMAVVLAGFLFEDESRSGVARALLSKTLVALGMVDEARENARVSARIGNRVGGGRASALAELAQAEASLAVGLVQDAFIYSQDALKEAMRTRRSQEITAAHELRARILLSQSERMRAAGDEAGAVQCLEKAISEVNLALERATRAFLVADQIAAHITLSRCYLAQGANAEAEQETLKANELIEHGGANLARLLGDEATKLPEMLRSDELNLHNLFASNRLILPGLEWQVKRLEAVFTAKRLGPEAAFDASRASTEAILLIMRDLNPSQSSGFERQNPDVPHVFDMLLQFAVTDETQREARLLLEGTRKIGGMKALGSV